MAVKVGTRLGPYEVTGQIGAGGMGEVYRAHDTTLDRDVAIKVLPDAFAIDPERLARFEREAKVLASLNHPNIAAIYGLETSEETRALVLELVEGPTLQDRIAQGPIPLDEALPIARQIAEALEAAHEQGIIHRDLKPANVKVKDDGTVKVLDFGLAKALEPALSDTDAAKSPTLTAADTRMGVIMGTPAYMSPEQARGGIADRRSDVWAFGVVLFEMLTGQATFDHATDGVVDDEQGKTVSDTMALVLTKEPDWATLPANTPVPVRRLLRRCLEKVPKQRLSSISDARLDIDDARTAPSDETTEAASIARPAFWQRPVPLLVAGLFLAVVSGLAVWTLRAPGASASAIPRLANPIQITSAIGVEDYPAWSRDGQMLAYVSRQDGNADIWITPIGGRPLNRTADHSGEDLAPAWSPDGREIAFFSDRDGGGLFAMAALAGTPRMIEPVQLGNTRGQWYSATWLANGTELAYEERNILKIVTLRTGEIRRVDLPGTEIGTPAELSWSADERYVAYWVGEGVGSATGQIWVLRQSDGEGVPVTDGQTWNVGPSWMPDGGALYFVSNRGGGRDLWQQRLSGERVPVGEPERVTAGVGMRHAVVSPDGTKLAYVRGGEVSNVWRVPILDGRRATWAEAEQFTFDEAYAEGVDVSPDGTRLLISSDRSGNHDLWTLPVGGGEMQQLTTDPAMDCCGRWSPDGEDVSFYSLWSGNRDIWVMPVGGGPARQLTSHEATDYRPAWSPDGSELVFQSRRDVTSALWIVDVGTGELRPLVSDAGGEPVWSPDGQWVAYNWQAALWRVPAAGGEPEELTRSEAAPAVWSADSLELYFERSGNYWALSLADRSERRLTEFEGRHGSLLESEVHSTDGQYLYFLWNTDIGDIWVADLVWEEAIQD